MIPVNAGAAQVEVHVDGAVEAHCGYTVHGTGILWMTGLDDGCPSSPSLPQPGPSCPDPGSPWWGSRYNNLPELLPP